MKWITFLSIMQTFFNRMKNAAAPAFFAKKLGNQRWSPWNY